MTIETTPTSRRGDELAPAFYRASREASEEFLANGHIPEPLARSLEVLSAALAASNAVGITNRIGRIAEALESEYIE